MDTNRTATEVVTTFDPEVPDYLLTTTKAEYIADNAETFSDEEIEKIRDLGVGEALSIPSGGGCFFVVVGVSDYYHVAYAEGQYFGLHHDRPEDIEWTPIS